MLRAQALRTTISTRRAAVELLNSTGHHRSNKAYGTGKEFTNYTFDKGLVSKTTNSENWTSRQQVIRSIKTWGKDLARVLQRGDTEKEMPNNPDHPSLSGKHKSDEISCYTGQNGQDQ